VEEKEGKEGRKIDEDWKEGRERGKVFLVSIKRLSRFGMSIPKLWTRYCVLSVLLFYVK